jgi:MFS family permease
VSPTGRLVTPRFALVVAAGLSYFLSLTMLQPVLPRYIEEPLDSGAIGVGVGVGALAVGAVLLRPIAGRLGDRIGRRVLIVGGAAVVACTTVLYGVLESLPYLVTMRLLSGIGEAAFFVGAATMITDLAPIERRGEAVSYWSVAVYGGVAFGPVLGETVLGDDRYTLTWIVSAGLAGLAAVLGLFTRDVERTGPPPESPPLLHRAAIQPGIVLFLGLVALAGFVAFLPLYVSDIGLDDAGPIFLLYGGLILLIRIVGATLPDRLGAVRSSTISLAFVAAGMLVVTAWQSPAGLVIGTIVFALGMSLHYPALMLLALSGIPDSERASVVGTFSSFFDLSQGLGALVCGAAVAAFGSDAAAFGTGAALSAIGLLVLLTSKDIHHRATLSHVSDESHAAQPL